MRSINLKHIVVSGLFLFTLFSSSPLYAAGDHERARMALIELLGEEETFDSRVLGAISRVSRHLFVPKRYRDEAYENVPLPIGHGQTISQPYVVALMTDLLELKRSDKVLEVGTGSGYQAAILAELSDSVYTIEIIEKLAERSNALFTQLNYKTIHRRAGDGYYGWQEAAPFDAIIVTAAADHIPPPLIRQLKPGGRMIIPVGSRFMVQQLVLLEKDSEGRLTQRQILPVRFVPLTGDHDKR